MHTNTNTNQKSITQLQLQTIEEKKTEKAKSKINVMTSHTQPHKQYETHFATRKKFPSENSLDEKYFCFFGFLL